ncbi:DUF397 domain-containing protein [Streptomyces inhibens]|uniref:DUF397 domain-containing protein n=1 Tax=Streptomyces inhibens TaxID=2293571 RepID=A0A371PQ10_STRIH|nr:DUF397 domain-containing protein [Streptomyces inhibens]REK84582.1 DUF397 domain-containing protein [Streptomyces inhibens]
MKPEIVSEFRKPSYSNQQGDCVEVAHTADGGRVVRDSKELDGGALFCPPSQWTSFLGAVKAGQVPAAGER